MAELGALPSAAALLAFAPRGDGHPVLVLPGYLGSDDSTSVLRGFLAELGHQTLPWKLGRNLGPRVVGLTDALITRLGDAYALAGGRKVSLVGWSLGGVQARRLALDHPEWVRSVVMLGSPLGGMRAATVSRFYEQTTGRRRSPGSDPGPLDAIPRTAIFSRSDGVVAWPAAVEPETSTSESIEVCGSHLGLGFNAAVLYAVADRLAQPEGRWRPFDRSGWRSIVYGKPPTRAAKA